MPCHTPPPNYEGEAQRNAEEAVKILCEMLKPRVKAMYNTIYKNLLLWFIEHRRIDIEINKYYHYKDGAKQEIVEATEDIKIAKKLYTKKLSG